MLDQACTCLREGLDGRDSVHVHYTSANVHLAFDPDILKGLLPKAILAEGLAASSYGTA